MNSKKRDKRSVQVHSTDAPYQKAVDTLSLFIRPDTFNVIELLAWYYPLTDNEWQIVSKGKMDAPMQSLLDFKIVTKKRGMYELNKSKIASVNTTLKTIGKYARK